MIPLKYLTWALWAINLQDHTQKRLITLCTWTVSSYLPKLKKELSTFIQAIWIYSHDIGMEFGIEKFVRLIMKRGKRKTNQDRIRTLSGKENFKYIGILEAGIIKQTWMTEKKKHKEKRKNKCTPDKRGTSRNQSLQQKSHQMHKHLEKMDQRIRKLMTMHKLLHTINDINKLYVSSKDQWRWHISSKDCVDASI